MDDNDRSIAYSERLFSLRTSNSRRVYSDIQTGPNFSILARQRGRPTLHECLTMMTSGALADTEHPTSGQQIACISI